MKHFQSTNETLPIILQKPFRLITGQKQQMKCKYLTQNKPNKIKNTNKVLQPQFQSTKNAEV